MPSMHRATIRREKILWKNGFQRVAGVDEAGRGAWAGPLVAAAVIFPDESGRKIARRLSGVRDSKTLTPKARERLFSIIIDVAVAWGVGVVSPATIDTKGIVEANRRAMNQALHALRVPPEYILIDAFALATSVPTEAVPLGDDTVRCIAAASIIAKVMRDRLMRNLHTKYPHYGFDRHKGYGTFLHEQMLKRHGISSLHRKTFLRKRLLWGPQ